MKFTPIPVVPVLYSEKISAPVLVIEIRSIERIDILASFGVILDECDTKRLTDSLGTKKTTTLFFYPKNASFQEIRCVFFAKDADIHEERAKLLRSVQDEVYAYYPHFDEKEALHACVLSLYLFCVYKTKPDTKKVYFLYSDADYAEELHKELPLLEAVYQARDIVNMPSYDLYPESFMQLFREKKWKHFSVEIFGEEDLKKMGCNLICAVGAGSDRESYMVVLTPKNPPQTEKYALVGKGVTFDSGGVQIKPDKGMEDMKCDMAGGAAVFALASYLDSLDTLPVNITLAVGLTENMTGWSAYKPLDIYSAYNGTTVEVVHTDAEGRLVLADVMSYVEKNTKPDHIITIATLTGACIYALGYDIAGIMGDDDFVIDSILQTEVPFESVWRLPVSQKMKKSLESEYADIKTLSEEKAGSSIGGAFLSYFQGDAKFTHIDIAGPSYRPGVYGYMPKAGTGWGVRLLAEFFTSFRP